MSTLNDTLEDVLGELDNLEQLVGDSSTEVDTILASIGNKVEGIVFNK